jgi:beta-lactamase class A
MLFLRLSLALAVALLVPAQPATAGHEGIPSEGLPIKRQETEPARAVAALPVPDPALEAVIRTVLGSQAQRYGVVVEELRHGTGAALNPYRVFNTASLFKLLVMHEAFRQRALGRLSFREMLLVTQGYAAWDLGTLRAVGISVGDWVSIGRLVEVMITHSDNTSAVMLGDRLGWRNIDQGIRGLGLSTTSVNTPQPYTTAADMAALLEAIARGLAVSSQASAEMESLLLRQQIRDRIPQGVPAGVSVGNKTGNWTDATHDVAIVYAPWGTYVLAVLSDRPWTNAPIVELSRQVYQYYAGRAFHESSPSRRAEEPARDAGRDPGGEEPGAGERGTGEPDGSPLLTFPQQAADVE